MQSLQEAMVKLHKKIQHSQKHQIPYFPDRNASNQTSQTLPTRLTTAADMEIQTIPDE